MDPPYRIGLPSPIHGEGAFATRLIRRGEMVPLLTVGTIGWGGFNHSCDPNLGSYLEVDDDHAVRQALRDIQPGEELTIRYSTAPKCYCQTCKGQHSSSHCNCPKCRDQRYLDDHYPNRSTDAPTVDPK